MGIYSLRKQFVPFQQIISFTGEPIFGRALLSRGNRTSQSYFPLLNGQNNIEVYTLVLTLLDWETSESNRVKEVPNFMCPDRGAQRLSGLSDLAVLDAIPAGDESLFKLNMLLFHKAFHPDITEILLKWM